MKNLLLFLFISTSIFSQNKSNGETLINEFLLSHYRDYNLQIEDVQDLKINSTTTSNSMLLDLLYVNQMYQGIEIYNAISTFSIKDNKVFSFRNRYYSDIYNKINTTSALLTPRNAILKAVDFLQLGNVTNLQLLSNQGSKYIFNSAGISQVEIPVKLVFYPTENDLLKLAWDLSIHSNNGKYWYSLRIDALNGEVLNQSDWIINCSFEPSSDSEINTLDFIKQLQNGSESTKSVLNDGSQYNVFALPTESPIHGPRQLLYEPSNVIASPYGWHDTNGEIGPEYTITRGNNVWAREDVDGNGSMGGNGYSPDGTENLSFDYELNFDQQPIGYQDASLTNLFYINNMMHDIWYQYGFDEQSGNFQENNYGNSTSPWGGSDSVNADGQDGDGMNNASFGTPPDGGNPTMTMYLWNGPPGEPLTINNGSLAGSYTAIPAGFGTDLPSDIALTADLVLVTDTPIINTDFYDACESITNGSEISGKIAVIRRGTCEFGFKILAAQSQGAIGVIMVNNVPGPAITMGEGADDASNTPPSVMINQEIGESLIDELQSGASINVSLLLDTYNLDGSFDNGIVAHEYGHGISTRLTGGASASGCLQNDEQMGEGWSDWFGLMITMEEGDLPAEPRGIGTFASGQSNTGNGIRNAPYSTDFSINNYTYTDSNNESQVSQPHGVGFVYATMLWDLTWAYVDKYGFDSDIFNGNGGNNKVMQLMLDALKLQACNPGFVDGRDSILLADMATTGGENQCLIWEVFANRGLGYSASQGEASSRTDQVEAFDMPPESDPSLVNCGQLSIEDQFVNNIKVYPNPTNGLININSNIIIGNTYVSLVDMNGRIIYNENLIIDLNNQIKIDNLKQGIYILNILNNSININYKIIVR